MRKLLVLADEHAQFVVIHTDVVIKHVFGNPAAVVDVSEQEVEHHVGVVHCGLAVCLLGEAVVVVAGLHDFDEFIHGVVELMVLTVVGEHRAYLLLREANHLVEVIVE